MLEKFPNKYFWRNEKYLSGNFSSIRLENLLMILSENLKKKNIKISSKMLSNFLLETAT